MGKRHQDGLPLHGLAALSPERLTAASMMGKSRGQRIRVRGEISQHCHLYVAWGKAPSASQISLKPSQGERGLISPKPLSWNTGLKSVRLERTKTSYLGRGGRGTLVSGHSTTISFIMANFTLGSVRADLGQTQTKPFFLLLHCCVQDEGPSRQISYDTGIGKVLLGQHFSNQSSLNEQWSLKFSGSNLYRTQEAIDQANLSSL